MAPARVYAVHDWGLTAGVVAAAVMTLYSAIVAKSYFLVMLSVALQVGALLWTSVGYLPRGQAALKGWAACRRRLCVAVWLRSCVALPCMSGSPIVSWPQCSRHCSAVSQKSCAILAKSLCWAWYRAMTPTVLRGCLGRGRLPHERLSGVTGVQTNMSMSTFSSWCIALSIALRPVTDMPT